MNKFGRNYELRVEATGGGPDVVVRLPFTIEFDVQRHQYSSATISVLKIYNLSESTRGKLRKNQLDFALSKKCTFRAGYGDKLSTLLVGNVMVGSSVRIADDWVTTLEIFDGGLAYANATVPSSSTYVENTPYKTVVYDLIKSLAEYGIGMGSIGTVPGTTGRGLSLSGSTIYNLKELTEGKFFIDNNVANVLGSTETVPAPLQVLSSSSGLLGTPTREQTYVNVDLLFEPKILAGQQLKLISQTDKSLNNIYKVITIRHSGIISEAVNGDCTTNLTLVYGLGALIDVPRGL